ncbi:hypothetical protein DHB64_17735 [Antarcticibacterium sp. W02-3]|nr:hypothetical protein [Antarcticibacterium sp. W02-3]
MKRTTKRVATSVFFIILILFCVSVYNFISNKKILKSAELARAFVTDTIPFDYAPSGHMLIKVKINGSDKSYPNSKFRAHLQRLIVLRTIKLTSSHCFYTGHCAQLNETKRVS